MYLFTIEIIWYRKNKTKQAYSIKCCTKNGTNTAGMVFMMQI